MEECPVCGAKYKLIKQHYPMRDKDKIRCKYCGREIISWNGGVIYDIEYLGGPTKTFTKIAIDDDD